MSESDRISFDILIFGYIFYVDYIFSAPAIRPTVEYGCTNRLICCT